MTQHRLLKHKRFLEDIEKGIRIANREIIHAHITDLDSDMFLAFAVSVGRLRARYLDSALKLFLDEDEQWPAEGAISALRKERERFEESLSAFDALRRAIEQGYVDLDGDEQAAE